MKLSEYSSKSRADRHDEWTVDSFIRRAKELEQQNAELERALEICAGWVPEWWHKSVSGIVEDAKQEAKEAGQ